MYKINIKRIKGLMTEEGETINSLSEKAGVNRNTMANYLRCPEKMPYGIIAVVAKTLCKTPEQATEIFFA